MQEEIKCNWLFESDVFDEGIKDIVNCVRNLGMIAEIAHYVPLQSGQTYLNIFNKEDCVFFYGSLGFAEQLLRESAWNPGVIYNVNNYKCSHYYNYFGKYHLADSYAMVPYGDLFRIHEELYEKFGCGADTIFVRPDRGNKPFTGQLMEKKYFEKDYDYIGFADLKPHDLVVVGEPRNITDEWRFIVADRKVVAGSQYRKYGQRFIGEYSSNAYAVAKSIAKVEWQPDRAYSLDICRTWAGHYSLLEIGTVSCSGYYGCEIEPIVKAISNIAVDEWKMARGL
jgi:hypothetical protein